MLTVGIDDLKSPQAQNNNSKYSRYPNPVLTGKVLSYNQTKIYPHHITSIVLLLQNSNTDNDLNPDSFSTSGQSDYEVKAIIKLLYVWG